MTSASASASAAAAAAVDVPLDVKDFDPTDPKYAVDIDQYKPDKESSWPYPPSKDGWCLVHRALTQEVEQQIVAYQSMMEQAKSHKEGTTETLTEWQLRCLQSAWEGHYQHVHWHHHDEDDYFGPQMSKRFIYPQRIASDHPKIEAQIDKVKTMIHALQVGDQIVDKLTPLVQEFEQYKSMIVPHMKEEETFVLPLLRAYFTPKDMEPIIQTIATNGPKIEFGSAIYNCQGGPEGFRQEFMKQEGIPFFVWYIDFQFRLAEYERRVAKPLEALQNGIPPVDGKAGFLPTGGCDIL